MLLLRISLVYSFLTFWDTLYLLFIYIKKDFYLLWHILRNIHFQEIFYFWCHFRSRKFLPLITFSPYSYSNMYLSRLYIHWNHSLLSLQCVNSYTCKLYSLLILLINNCMVLCSVIGISLYFFCCCYYCWSDPGAYLI